MRGRSEQTKQTELTGRGKSNYRAGHGSEGRSYGQAGIQVLKGRRQAGSRGGGEIEMEGKKDECAYAGYRICCLGIAREGQHADAGEAGWRRSSSHPKKKKKKEKKKAQLTKTDKDDRKPKVG